MSSDALFKNNVKIVILDHSNKHLLSNIAPEVFDHPIKEDSLNDFLNCSRHLMSLALNDDTVVGMASAVEYFHPDKKSQLWINEVGVSPQMRNQGIGRHLVQRLIDEGKKRGCIFAWLGTGTENIPAQKCFESVGKTKSEEFLMYKWDLNPEK